MDAASRPQAGRIEQIRLDWQQPVLELAAGAVNVDEVVRVLLDAAKPDGGATGVLPT